jgi:aminoglycoside phosphotransferase family enzyme
VRLNRRLAGDVYEGVVRLTRESDGRLALDGMGETIDRMVVQRRLPRAHAREAVRRNYSGGSIVELLEGGA